MLKKLILILFICSIFTNSYVLAAQDDTVTIKRSQLTESQKKELDNITQNKANWATGVGHELGTAVNESLSAVTDNAQKFANTGAGKITIAIIAWKIIGSQLTQFLDGLLLMTSSLLVFVFFYWKNCTVRKVLISNNKESGKTYKVVNEYDRSDKWFIARAFHIVPFILLTLIACTVMGGGCS